MEKDNNGNIIAVGSSGAVNGNYYDYYSQFITLGDSVNGSFIVKFSPNGGRIWAFAFPIEVSDISISNFDNSFFITGATSTLLSYTNLATPDTWMQQPGEGFLAHFSADGQLLMFTYLPFSSWAVCHNENQIFVGGMKEDNSPLIQEVGSANSFQPQSMDQIIQAHNLEYSVSQSIIMSFDYAGNKLWGTYYGLSKIWDLAVSSNDLYAVGYVTNFIEEADGNYYVTPQAFYNSDSINYPTSILVKLNPATGQRNWATYTSKEFTENYSVCIGNNRNIYIAGFTNSNTGVATENAFVADIPLYSGDFFINCFDINGSRIWGSYAGSGVESLVLPNLSLISTSGNKVLLTGHTESQIPVTDSCDQPEKHQNADGFVHVFNAADGTHLYGSYFGGEKNDFLIHPLGESDTSFYLYGETLSRQYISTSNSFQPVFSVIPDPNVSNYGATNGFIAKFVLDTGRRIAPDTTHNPNNPDTTNNPGNPDTTHNPTDPPAVNPIPGLDSLDLVLFPNPNDGAFAIGGWPLTKASYELEFFDAAGRQLAIFKLSSSPLQHFNFARAYPFGVYFARLINLQTKKQTTYKVLKK